MSSMQIVFLFDLNAFNDDRTKSNEELQAKLMCLRLACLRILTHYSNAIPNLKWGFKFFDSLGSLTQTMCNFSFINVSLENFETLENEICSRYHRHIAYQEALALSVQDQSIDEEISFSKEAPIRLLHLALTQILCEYHWNDSIDMFSPSIRKIFARTTFTQSIHIMDLAKYLSESGSFLKNSLPDILTMIAESLRSLQCALVPLSVLSVPNYILKLENSFKKQESEISNLGISYNCLIPFSASVFQSFMYPFYLSRKEISVEAKLCFLENDLQVPIIVTKVPLHWNEKEYKLYHDRSLHQTTHTRYLNEKIVKLNIPISWKKFTVHFTIARHVQLKPCNILLCMSNVSIKSSNYCWLQLLIKSLFLKNVNLFVVCESSCGLTFPGIFTSLSETSSVISILNPNACFINKTNPAFVTSKSPNDFNISDVKHSLEIESENFKLNIDNSKKNFDDMNENKTI
ncbi:uncharacterized protein CEXT_788561 [Caerostris extrusa]|uniref:Treslin N-terminal domain-containing protein n=1 Tax=Caerostris extrusa TaxID=172846 RepID=A0AAV4NR22_CAEEX|nr:uncharacterized protein CEXT_788561 [Caerostris extrusa]